MMTMNGEKKKLEKQLKKILSDHSALVYCDYYYIDKNGKMNIRKSDKQNLPGSNDLRDCFAVILLVQLLFR